MKLKRVRTRDFDRLMALWAEVSDRLQDPTSQSTIIWRGDMRAIEWAAWWISETVRDARRGQK